MTKIWFLVFASILISSLLAAVACARPAPPPAAPPTPAPAAPAVDPASIARGGRLYDKWWKEAKVEAPKADHDLWARQTTNKKAKGADTWRCKECHGWDYKGMDGVYGPGSSRYTGFAGVLHAATKHTSMQLLGNLKGVGSPHDFSKVMDEKSLTDLANFLSQSLIDLSKSIDYKAMKPLKADAAKGVKLYEGTCATCHGLDGKLINFGKPEDPEYVGSVAIENPWEFMHKVRYGQPDTPMPAAIVTGWSLQDVLDVLAHAQTLPEK